MDWLCEVTPEELVRVGKRTNTMVELEAAVRKYVERRTKRRNVYDPICSECGSKSFVMIDGADTCTQCGTSDINNFSYYVSYNYKKTTILRRSPLTIESDGSRDTYLNMLLPGTGIPYGSSLEAS